jgi:hypothetical protein
MFVKVMEIDENFREIFGKFPKFRKFAKNFRGSFSRKLPENFRKTWEGFTVNARL